MSTKSQRIASAILIFLILTSLVSCSPEAPIAPEGSSATLSTQAPTIGPGILILPPESQLLPSFGNELTESVKLAKQDLAQRLAVPVDSITNAGVIGQDFSTNAFYCRTTKDRIAKEEPTVVISGFSIFLSASGHRYEYHATGQSVIFCRPLS